MVQAFNPRFQITPAILNYIGTVEACREVIVNAPIVPAWERRFVQEATLRTVYYGTVIEGNALSLEQAREVLEGKQVMARQRDVQEILNYRNVIDYLDRLVDAHRSMSDERAFEYTQEIICRIQALAVYRTIDQSVGEYRKDEVVVKSVIPTEPDFRAPPARQVPRLMDRLLAWLNLPDSRQIHPVLRAGIALYLVVAIHPFLEGNGRTARAVATLILFVEGYDIRRLFSLEEHFDRDLARYYQELQRVSSQSSRIDERDLTSWLEYFCEVMAVELTRVKDQVQKLSMDLRLKNKFGRQIALSERQIKLVEYMRAHDELYMKDAKQLITNVSEDTILRDLKDLIKKGLVKKRGKTKAARYVLV